MPALAERRALGILAPDVPVLSLKRPGQAEELFDALGGNYRQRSTGPVRAINLSSELTAMPGKGTVTLQRVCLGLGMVLPTPAVTGLMPY
jgi:hypothetical protein